VGTLKSNSNKQGREQHQQRTITTMEIHSNLIGTQTTRIGRDQPIIANRGQKIAWFAKSDELPIIDQRAMLAEHQDRTRRRCNHACKKHKQRHQRCPQDCVDRKVELEIHRKDQERKIQLLLAEQVEKYYPGGEFNTLFWKFLTFPV